MIGKFKVKGSRRALRYRDMVEDHRTLCLSEVEEWMDTYIKIDERQTNLTLAHRTIPCPRPADFSKLPLNTVVLGIEFATQECWHTSKSLQSV